LTIAGIKLVAEADRTRSSKRHSNEEETLRQECEMSRTFRARSVRCSCAGRGVWGPSQQAEIGDPIREIEVTPIEEPLPEFAPVEEPVEEPVEPTRQPERVPA
jgi:hypothetical protein